MIAGGQEVSAVAAAKPGSVDHDRTPVLLAALTFRPRPGPARLSPQRVILDRVTVVLLWSQYYTGLQSLAEIKTVDDTVNE
ncbi:hypothetical protein B566_EDAN010712 [Ephemera danica]|nr:hypothetical protein B566_EDAN010712 [Ephemera danica]